MRYIFTLLLLIIIHSSAIAVNETKLPIPSEAELAAPNEIIQEVFGEELEAAKDAKTKSELAMKFISTSLTAKDPSEKYALLALAQKLALEAKDQHLYFHLLETLSETFQVDKIKLWSDMLLQQLQGQVEEPAARQLAELDFAASNESEKRIVAADTWYELATTLKGPAVKIATDRAALHYRAAMPGLKGLVKMKAQKRLEDCVNNSVVPTSESDSQQDEPEDQSKRYGHGRIIAIDCTKGLDTRDAQRFQRNAARSYGVPLEFKSKFNLTFRFIPAGTFVMGSPEDEPYRDADEKQRVVDIPKPFYMSTTEVTQLQYWNVTGQNPSNFKDRPNNPVEMVNWNAAETFCKKLTELDGKRAYRLPTENEWEYACRAGTLTATYGPLETIACYRNNSNGHTMPVGRFAPNAWGLYDCIGNAWEWVADGPGAQLRGGCWDDPVDRGFFRSGSKHPYPKDQIHEHIGFRVICTVEP